LVQDLLAVLLDLLPVLPLDLLPPPPQELPQLLLLPQNLQHPQVEVPLTEQLPLPQNQQHLVQNHNQMLVV
jgi:hypothetical protein